MRQRICLLFPSQTLFQPNEPKEFEWWTGPVETARQNPDQIRTGLFRPEAAHENGEDSVNACHGRAAVC